MSKDTRNTHTHINILEHIRIYIYTIQVCINTFVAAHLSAKALLASVSVVSNLQSKNMNINFT